MDVYMKKRKWGICLALVLFVWVCLSVVGHSQEMPEMDIQETELYAQAAVLMDGDTGRVLYGKNADQILAMASTTKIMTCIIALENGELEETVEVSAYAAGMPQVKMGIRKGETYSLRDLLYALMLESHNDAAVAIAEHIGKELLSEDLKCKSPAEYTGEESRQAVAAFASLMNKKAAQLGCVNTWFITPNGLDGEEILQLEDGKSLEKFHSTTARELARIMSYCILESPQKEDFLTITRTAAHTISANGRTFACNNHNAFLTMMPGAISGKTGFTNRAGYCYVGALEDEGRTFVVALLACGWPNHKNYKWSDTRRLMNYGMENYYYRSFLDEETVFDKKWLKPILVEVGQTAVLGENAYVNVEVRQTEENTGNKSGGQLEGLLMKAGEEVVVEYDQQKVLAAPVESGTLVGNVSYMVDGVTYRKEEIVTTHTVERIDWQWCLEQIWDRFLLF